MARFRMTYAFSFGSVKVPAGKYLADSAANSAPGDFIWTGLTAATVPRGATAADAAGITMLAASPWAGVTWGWASGAESVDG
jgi:hypothetical protein